MALTIIARVLDLRVAKRKTGHSAASFGLGLSSPFILYVVVESDNLRHHVTAREKR